MLKKFLDYHSHINLPIFESKNMLDISILNINKVLDSNTSNDSKIKSFLTSSWRIEEKFDGTKLSLYRNEEKFDKTDFTKNWIVAYKGNILYSHEYHEIDRNEIRKNSIGISQYALVFDWLQSVHARTSSIPNNTEFFIEYMMNKPTLTRTYERPHNLILIGWASSKYQKDAAKLGFLKTLPGKMNFDIATFAKTLSLNTPPVLVNGPLFPYASLLKSIVSPEAKKAFQKYAEKLEQTNEIGLYYDILYEFLLSINSVYGGKIEGVVLKNGKSIYKILQSDQHDKLTRQTKASIWKADPEIENKYYQRLHDVAKDLVMNLKSYNLNQSLSELSKIIYKSNLIDKSEIFHPKKNHLQIADDLLLTAKTKLIKKLSGNNGALFIGRFQPPTRAHIDIVLNAQKKYDYVIVGHVDAKKRNEDNPFDETVIKKLWETAIPGIEIVTSVSGNLLTFINKIDKNINAVIAGTDRANSYRDQLRKNPDIVVEEIKRTNEDISATKLREALRNDNFDEFKKNAHPRTHGLYEYLKNEINNIHT